MIASSINYGSVSNNNASTEKIVTSTLIERQASCLLEDAEEYRSIDHRIDEHGLQIFKLLYSKYWKFTWYFSIVSLHFIAFLEFPSSLSLSSHFNENNTIAKGVPVPLGLTLSFEAIFLLFILSDAVFQSYLFGVEISLKNPWLICLFVLMFISWIDFFVSAVLEEAYYFRIRRFFRPLFAIERSQLMKKVLKSLSKSILDIFSAFLLLVLWIIAFTLIAVSIFNGFESKAYDEKYQSFYSGFFTLLVLLTTANNPDAMIKVYNDNRLSFIFFVLFMSVGIFVFMNVLIAIVYNEFRGHVLESMEASLFRRRVAERAFYEVLRNNLNKADSINQDEVDIETLKSVIKNASICKWRQTEMLKKIDLIGFEVVDWKHLKIILGPLDEHKESKMQFPVPRYRDPRITKCQKFLLSKSFEMVVLLVCLANVIVIAIDVSNKFKNESTAAISLDVFNWIFIMLYIIEQTAKYLAMGRQIYFSKQGCIIDFVITIGILVMKIAETALMATMNREDYIFGKISVWDLPRITNLLILARAVRIVLFFPSLTPIINTLFDIPCRMKSVIGLMLLLFYSYALLGMNVFGGKINFAFMNKTTECGSYQQLEYGGINFNDFYSSIVTLWCLLIVNNWHVFMVAFEQAFDSKFVHIYMISWWVVSVIILLNCVTAFVIEAYTQRKTYYEAEKAKRSRPRSVSMIVEDSLQYLRSSVVVNNSFTFQMLFKNDIVEPTEEDLMKFLKKCKFLCEYYHHIAHSHYESA